MIDALHGTVVSKSPDRLVVMVSGVGYGVNVPNQTAVQANIDETLLLHTYTHVREDALELFGFATVAELRLFKKITAVSGIGSKRALSVIDRGVSHIEHAVIQGDVTFFTSIPRLGKKNAQKLIIELKSVFDRSGEFALHTDSSTQELLSALKVLGFKQQEVAPLLSELSEDTLEGQIRQVLRRLGK